MVAAAQEVSACLPLGWDGPALSDQPPCACSFVFRSVSSSPSSLITRLRRIACSFRSTFPAELSDHRRQRAALPEHVFPLFSNSEDRVGEKAKNDCNRRTDSY